MSEIKKIRVRTVEDTGYVGVQLTPELIKKLDRKMEETTLKRSQIIRLALIDYLDK